MKRAQRIASAFSAVALTFSLAAGFASCRAVVTGDARDAVAELCALLKSCYGDDKVDCEAIRTRFGADTSVDDGFLSFMTSAHCLSSCAAAKGCWDHLPICLAETSACTEVEQCCGFTKGHSDCVAGTCCLPQGTTCDEGSTCCGELACQRSPDGETKTCGGKAVCREVDDPCETKDQCCSDLCLGGHCSVKTCSDVGDGCHIDNDCCPPPTGTIVCDPGTSKCTPVSCSHDSCNQPTPCSFGVQNVQCCGDPNLYCAPDPLQEGGLCLPSDASGVPEGFPCAVPENCCLGVCRAGICDSSTCTEDGLACGSGNNLAPPDEGDEECCSGQCLHSCEACGGSPYCATCAASECHSIHDTGPPIACPTSDPEAFCVQEVCAHDEFCCCIFWDGQCLTDVDLYCISAGG